MLGRRMRPFWPRAAPHSGPRPRSKPPGPLQAPISPASPQVRRLPVLRRRGHPLQQDHELLQGAADPLRQRGPAAGAADRPALPEHRLPQHLPALLPRLHLGRRGAWQAHRHLPEAHQRHPRQVRGPSRAQATPGCDGAPDPQAPGRGTHPNVLSPPAAWGPPLPPTFPSRKGRQGGRGARRESPLLCGAAPRSSGMPGALRHVQATGAFGGLSRAQQGQEVAPGPQRAPVWATAVHTGPEPSVTASQGHREDGLVPRPERVRGAWGLEPPLLAPPRA